MIRRDAKAEAKAGRYGERICARWISCATVLIRGRMISLKKYLDSAPSSTNADCWQQKDEIASVAIAAYGSALESMGNCSLDACPSLGSELKQRLGELNRNLSSRMNCESLELTDRQVQEQLQDWGRRTELPNSAAADSTAAGELVSSSGRSRVEETQPQQAITQEQNRIQAQPDGQVSERVAPLNASDHADRSSYRDIADASHSYATLAGAVRPAATGEGKVSQVVLRSSRFAITGSQTESGNHSLKVENNGLLQDASALVRDSASTHRAMSATDGNVGGLASAPTRSGAHDTFAALDADTLTGTPSWIHAGARRAEAGFQDPALGWVGVRAEASGGTVHATLMSGSVEAAQTLGGHMAGLNAYLAEEHSSVATLTLAAPEGRGSGLDAGQDANHGMNQGGGQNSPSEPQSNPHPVIPAIATAAAREIPGLTGNSGRAVGFTGSEGSHISVMA